MRYRPARGNSRTNANVQKFLVGADHHRLDLPWGIKPTCTSVSLPSASRLQRHGFVGFPGWRYKRFVLATTPLPSLARGIFHFQDNSTLKIIRHPPMILASSAEFPHAGRRQRGHTTFTADVEKLVLTPTAVYHHGQVTFSTSTGSNTR